MDNIVHLNSAGVPLNRFLIEIDVRLLLTCWIVSTSSI
jgi:hypothetical protein